MQYWLIKSEPNTFSIDDLKSRSKKTEHWDGVRNYQARNFMQRMQKGDLAFFYHSSCKDPGIIGIVEIAKPAYPDFTSWDQNSEYFDPKSTPENPRWFMVDIKFKQKLDALISLKLLKEIRGLQDLPLVKKGTRLSIMPITKNQWDVIQNLI